MSNKAILGKVGLAVLVLGLPALFLVPYYRSVTAEYERFHGYMEETVDSEQTPPAWALRPFSPEECVAWGIDWEESCPGTKEFCKGALSSVVGRCVDTVDRRAYCESLDQAWMTTGFGYHDCEAKLASLPEDAKTQRKRREKDCAAGYRSVANHCRDLELAAP